MPEIPLLHDSAQWFAPQAWRRHNGLLMTGLIAIVAWLVYFPSLHGGFVLDDDLLLTHNSTITASDGLYRFWFTKEAPDYWPVSNSTLWLEWRLWGMNPAGYHVTNLLLHIADSLLVWLVLRKLAVPGAWLAALLFAVHPVNVESVAWIAQRKNVLALFFFLLSILWWLKGESQLFNKTATEARVSPKKSSLLDPTTFGVWYVLSLLSFVSAMLSKGSVAVLPLVLLLIIWWQRRRINATDVIKTAPFFLVAMILTVVNMNFQLQGVTTPIRDVTILQRLLGGATATWFYLTKALLPLHLAFVYPQWDIEPADLRWWLPLLMAVVVTALLVVKRNSLHAKWVRPILIAWAFFCLALLPAMGFVDVGYMRHSLVADHYQHIALIAVVILVAAAITHGSQKLQGTARTATTVGAVPIVITLMFLAHQQSTLYASPQALYQNAVENNPNSWLAHNNLGDALAQANRPQEAILQFEKTLALQPDSALAHNNLAMRLAEVGRLQEAIDHYQQALRLKPKYADAENNYALALDSVGRLNEAQTHFQLALECQPQFAEAHNNLGSLLLKMGRLEQAVEQFQSALKIKPDYFEAHNNLGIVLAKSALFSQAIDEYQQALWIKPDSAETQNNLGNALTKSGRAEEAIKHYQEALRLKPDYDQAYVDLAMAQFAIGRTAEAISTAESASELARLHGQTILTSRIDQWLIAHRTGSTIR
jgi:tetratricopeptide (TPR) repeat protein